MNKLQHVAARISTFKDWYKLVPPFNRFTLDATVHPRASRYPIYLPYKFDTDLGCCMEIFHEDMYGLKTLELPPMPEIVDLGANIGVFSVAAKSYFPHAHITAYEPDTRNFKALARNAPFADNIQKAVYSHTGTITFDNQRSPTERQVSDVGITLPCVSLDDALSSFDFVDLMKVDIQGSERAVFESASPETLSKIDYIIMEVEEPDKDFFPRFFHDRGFVTHWAMPQILHAHRIQ